MASTECGEDCGLCGELVLDPCCARQLTSPCPTSAWPHLIKIHGVESLMFAARSTTTVSHYIYLVILSYLSPLMLCKTQCVSLLPATNDAIGEWKCRTLDRGVSQWLGRILKEGSERYSTSETCRDYTRSHVV